MAEISIAKSVEEGQNIVIGIIVIAVTVAIGVFVVTNLNQAGNGTLQVAVDVVNAAIEPIKGGIQFLGLAFLVMVAVVIIKLLQGLGRRAA